MNNNILENSFNPNGLKFHQMTSKEQSDLMIIVSALRKQGLTQADVSKKCNISIAAVNRIDKMNKCTGKKVSMEKVERVYTFIRSYMLLHLYAPSYGEIADELHISKSTVKEYIAALFDAGLLETDTEGEGGNLPRAFRLNGYSLVAKF